MPGLEYLRRYSTVTTHNPTNLELEFDHQPKKLVVHRKYYILHYYTTTCTKMWETV